MLPCYVVKKTEDLKNKTKAISSYFINCPEIDSTSFALQKNQWSLLLPHSNAFDLTQPFFQKTVIINQRACEVVCTAFTDGNALLF